MNLAAYTATALSRNDIEDTPTNKNIVDGAIVELKDLDGNLVVIYDDATGVNPETQKSCDANGQLTFWAEVGDYSLEVNGSISFITIGASVKFTQQSRQAIEALYKSHGFNSVFFYEDGFIYEEYNDIGIYQDGTAYQPNPDTDLPYIAGVTPNLNDVQPVTVNRADGIVLDGGGSVQNYIDGQQFQSIDAVKSYPSLSKLIGQRITTGEYHAGKGYGGATYDVVSAGSVIPNDCYVIQGVADSGGAIVLRLDDGALTPEMFGLIGDYDFSTHSGTDNTANARLMINKLAEKGHQLTLGAGAKYMTDTLSFSKVNNPDYPSKAGRMSISGQAVGIATGDIEPQGSGFAHINGSSGRLFDFEGDFSISTPGEAGKGVTLKNILLIGGDSTSDVLYLEGSNGQLSISDSTIRVRNPAGNGCTEVSVWELTMRNILIRGDADAEDPSKDSTHTGIGHWIKSNNSGGQNNMKVYQNVNVYKCGYNRVVGRGDVTSGTFAPLVVIGGQCSNAQHYNEWLQGGVYNYTSIGWQSEGARRNGIRIDSDSGNDLVRSIKYITPYLTNTGRIEDGTTESFAIYIKDGIGVELDTPLFQNCGDGVYVDTSNGASDVLIRRPTFRTVTSYGQATGVGIKVTSGTQVKRIALENAVFNQNFNVDIDDPSSSLAASNAGGRLNYSNGSAEPSLKVGSPSKNIASVINFNNSSPVIITNFEDGEDFHELTVTFSNTNTTISSNANIYLKGGVNYTPASNKEAIKLIRNNGSWVQL